MTCGKPTKSHATSAPAPPVHLRTSATRSLRSGTSLMLIVWSAPNARASSSRPAIWSTTITVAAPMSLATAAAWMPSPPAPWMTTRAAEAQPGLVEAEDHLGQRAVHRRHELVGQLVGHLEEVAARPQVVVLGEGAVEVRELAGARAAARSWPGSWRAPCSGTRSSARTGRSTCRRRGRPPCSGRPSESVFTRAPSAATRPVISWPKIQPSSGRRSGASPRQKCRSEPQTLASETRMSDRVGLDLGQRDLAQLERLAGPEEDGGLAA